MPPHRPFARHAPLIAIVAGSLLATLITVARTLAL